MSATTADARHRRGALWLIAATIVGGGSGYIVTVYAGAALGAVAYEPFAVYWSSLYLIVAAVSGLQQEFARATTSADPLGGTGAALDRRSGGVAAAVLGAPLALGVVAAVSVQWWGPALIGESAGSVSAPLVLAIVGYCATAIVSGVLSGIGAWAAVAAMTMADGVLRLLLTSAALSTGSFELAAWAVAAPFIAVPVTAVLVGAKRLRGRVLLDASLSQIFRNAVATVLAAVAIGALVSGLPAILVSTSSTTEPGDLAGLLYGINLTRAPIIIAVLALQSYLIVHFRRSPHALRDLALASITVILGGGAVAALGWAAGPALVSTLGGEAFTLGSTEATIIIASGAIVALLTLSGSAVLAARAHVGYAVGWVCAATATILILVGMPDGTWRLLVALVVAPLLGVVIHLMAFAKRGTSRAPQDARPSSS